jgi:hypothetical protein
MIVIGSSKKMGEREGPASGKRSRPFFSSIKGEEPLKLAILSVAEPFQRLFLIDFFCYYVTIKKNNSPSDFTLLKAVSRGLLRGF